MIEKLQINSKTAVSCDYFNEHYNIYLLLYEGLNKVNEIVSK